MARNITQVIRIIPKVLRKPLSRKLANRCSQQTARSSADLLKRQEPFRRNDLHSPQLGCNDLHSPQLGALMSWRSLQL